MGGKDMCCCGVELKRGCQIWAVLYIIMNIVNLVSVGYALGALKVLDIPEGYFEVEDGDEREQILKDLLDKVGEWLMALEIVALVFTSLDLIINLLLLYSANVDSVCGCLVWVWHNIGKLVVVGVVIIVYLVWLGITFFIPTTALVGTGVLTGLAFILPAYVIVVVRRFVRQLETIREHRNRPIFVQPNPQLQLTHA